MSFEIYLQCFKKRKPAGIARAALGKLFSIKSAQVDDDEWHAVFGESESDIFLQPLDDSGDFIHNITVERPGKDIRLWEAIYGAMTLAPVILYFPGNIPPVVANSAVIGELPLELVEALGKPVVINSGAGIVTYIETA